MLGRVVQTAQCGDSDSCDRRVDLVYRQREELVSFRVKPEFLTPPNATDQHIVQVAREEVDYAEARQVSAEAEQRAHTGGAYGEARPPSADNPYTNHVDEARREVACHQGPVAGAPPS